MTLPPLITTEGLVLNNLMPDTGALGGYTPLGTASSEGISLMMRGVIRAAIATGDPARLTFAKFLFDSACTYFFQARPTDSTDQVWNHSWICNGGADFNVRGPLDPEGDLALTGYIYGRDAASTVAFTAGVGQLTPPPDIVYQAVSADTTFVWENVFADLVAGTSYDVDYYIDSGGNQVFGTQKGGSYGQPSIPVGQHDAGGPGKIVLTDLTLSGSFGVNYSVTVPGVSVTYGELYEAWPMWRQLAVGEVSTASDAIHWFLDAFQLGMELEPTNTDWTNAYNRLLDIWKQACTEESNTTMLFEQGTDGPYNDFPLTYSYAYGQDNVDDPSTAWNAVPPTTKYTAVRDTDGYVEFAMPVANAAPKSGGEVRYGVAFENSPLYLDYASTSSISMDMSSSVAQTITAAITGNNSVTYDASVLVGPTTGVQSIAIPQFMQFQQEPGDADGIQTGDWPTDGGGGGWTTPVYNAVPFPGNRLMLVGDSITWYNDYYFPTVPDAMGGHYEYYAFGMCGYWTQADQLLGGRLELELGIQTDLGGQGNGFNVAVAGSQVSTWWNPTIDPIGTTATGPMYAALNNYGRYDVVVMMGGTNDLAANQAPADVLLNLQKATTDIAQLGKWVFIITITPRTRSQLTGYTVAQQNTIRNNLLTVNQGLRDWVANDKPNNIFLVDPFSALLGPNGIDPAGWQSDDVNGLADTLGNYRADAPGIVFNHDGLHPTAGGAYVIGKALSSAMIAAGVPARSSSSTLGPLTLGPNLMANPSMEMTDQSLVYAYGSDGKPTSWGSTRAGWATGLGTLLIKDPNIHAGYTYGRMPDNWQFNRGTNATDQDFSTPVSPNITGGTFSNFLAYAFQTLQPTYPSLSEYMGDSTWPDGSVLVSVIENNGVPAIQLQINIPQTGNKNEEIVLLSHVPQDQHGPWDNYGYTTPDLGPVHANSVYNTGDMIMSECTVSFSNLNGTLHSWRQTLNFLGVNSTDTTNVSSGAKISSIGNSHNFWPPSDIDRVRMHPENKVLLMRSPAIIVPSYNAGEDRRYMQFKLEFGLDASAGPATATIIVQNPSVRKVTGGTPL